MLNEARSLEPAASVGDSITAWIQGLKAGDTAAAEQLWNRYFRSLVDLARSQLRAGRAVDNDEDIALSVFKSLCLGAERGHFSQLTDRQNLWPLLVLLTARKASNARRRERQQKRGGGRPLDEIDLETVCGREPSPEFTAMIVENCQCLLDRLDAQGRTIAVAKLDGDNNRQIAHKLACSVRTIERNLALIRRIWSEPDSTAGC